MSLPTIYHGPGPRSGPDHDEVQAALTDIVDRLNRLRPDLMPLVVCSVLLSFCCSQIDPVEAFSMIADNVGGDIGRFLAEQSMAPADGIMGHG